MYEFAGFATGVFIQKYDFTNSIIDVTRRSIFKIF